ncbi:MAG TPA: AI-2E family transporter [Burkholderiales bacterium]|nr:AI-2E family transporter [Burkholderiales bacterium]
MPALASPQLWAWITIALAAGLLVWLLSPILAPFLFAAILAYIFDPLVERLTRRRVPRTLAVVLVLLLALAVVVALMLVVLPLFYKETRLLMEKLPGFVIWFNTHAAPWLKSKLDLDFQLDVGNVTQLGKDMISENEALAKHLLSSLKTGGMLLIAILANLVLVPVVLFYLLRDWNQLLDRVDALIPRRVHAKARTIAAEIDAVLAEWLRGQVLVIVIMSVYYVLALWVAGLQFALPIGILTGFAVIIPYVGVITGLILATLAALMQFNDLAGLLWVWLAIGIGQALEGMMITPLIVGERIGLHPVVVIFALLAFGQLFGFFGVLLALPASAALLVALRHLRAAYLASPLYGGN